MGSGLAGLLELRHGGVELGHQRLQLRLARPLPAAAMSARAALGLAVPCEPREPAAELHAVSGREVERVEHLARVRDRVRVRIS